MTQTGSTCLLLAAALNALAAALHVGCIVFGAPWYRFFGAGERMAQMAAAGRWYPTIVASGITLVLCVWSLYALSGAGAIFKLPYVRGVLCVVTGVYLLRGVAGLPLMFMPMGRGAVFWLWSSAICLALAALHGLGLRQMWSRL
jgi:hypothetical protein